MSYHNDKVTRLIHKVEDGIKKNSGYVSCISYPLILIEGLNELNKMIGNDKLKSDMMKQINHIIMMKRRDHPIDNMLNTCIYGPPGTGKTMLTVILGKIWYAIGCYSGESTNGTPPIPILNNTITTVKKDNGELKELIVEGNVPDSKTGDEILDKNNKVMNNETGNGKNNEKPRSLRDSVKKTSGLGMWFLLYALVVIIFMLVVLPWWALAAIILIVIFFMLMGMSISTGIQRIKEDNNEEVVKSNKNIKSGFNESQYVKIITRADLVAPYVGQSAPKTRELLLANTGKTIFLDEGYELVRNQRDEFGIEASTELNTFLSTYPTALTFMTAGYANRFRDGLFRHQPGMMRRFAWYYDCSAGYSPDELYQVFLYHSTKGNWKIEDEEGIRSLIERHYKVFDNYAADIVKLLFFSSIENSDDILNGSDAASLLTTDQVRRGLDTLLDNKCVN